eukprot:scaffold5637_cov121-Isochrysis_galbana.AAC.7
MAMEDPAVMSCKRRSSAASHSSEVGNPMTVGWISPVQAAAMHCCNAAREWCSMGIETVTPKATSARAMATAPGGPSVSTGGDLSRRHGNPVRTIALPFDGVRSNSCEACSS